MKTGQGLVTLTAVDPAHIVVPEIFLALALLTIGIAQDPHANGGQVTEFVEEIRGKKQRRFAFVFEPQGTEGTDTQGWISRWSDKRWLAAHPQHPFAAYKALAQTYANFAGWMKDHEPLLVFRNALGGGLETGRRERVAYIPRNLMGTERGNEILRKAGIAI